MGSGTPEDTGSPYAPNPDSKKAQPEPGRFALAGLLAVEVGRREVPVPLADHLDQAVRVGR